MFWERKKQSKLSAEWMLFMYPFLMGIALLTLLLGGCINTGTAHRNSATSKRFTDFKPLPSDGLESDLTEDDDVVTGDFTEEQTSNNGFDEKDPRSAIGTEEPYRFEVRHKGFIDVDKPLTFTVKTRRILRAVYIPERNDTTLEGQGWAPQYTQFGLFFMVNSKKQKFGIPLTPTDSPSPMVLLHKALGDDGVCKSQGSTDCREDVNVHIVWPQSNHACIDWAYYLPQNFCFPPYYLDVQENHPWQGILYIQTDDTRGLDDVVDGNY